MGTLSLAIVSLNISITIGDGTELGLHLTVYLKTLQLDKNKSGFRFHKPPLDIIFFKVTVSSFTEIILQI